MAQYNFTLLDAHLFFFFSEHEMEKSSLDSTFTSQQEGPVGPCYVLSVIWFLPQSKDTHVNLYKSHFKFSKKDV